MRGRRAERRGAGGRGEEIPNLSPLSLIFAGGQTATSNPEPYADFFDFFALGDGEELLPEIGLVLEEGKQAGLSREQTITGLGTDTRCICSPVLRHGRGWLSSS